MATSQNTYPIPYIEKIGGESEGRGGEGMEGERVREGREGERVRGEAGREGRGVKNEGKRVHLCMTS